MLWGLILLLSQPRAVEKGKYDWLLEVMGNYVCTHVIAIIRQYLKDFHVKFDPINLHIESF